MKNKLTNQEWAELVQRAQNGEEEAFEELYRSSYDYLYAVCFKGSVPEEDIPDVLQESYIKIFKNLDTLDQPEKFLAWAAVVVKNTGRDKGRQRKTYYERNELMEDTSSEENMGIDALAVDEMDPDYNPGAALDKAATVRIVRDMIAELPETQRDCIVLWCEGKSMSDISEEVGIPVGSVKSSISYAKQKIKKMTLKIEQEQGIRLHTVAPMSFFIWAIGNIEELLDVAVPSFSAIYDILALSGQVVSGSAMKLAEGLASDTSAAQTVGQTAVEVGKKGAEQAVSAAGKKAAEHAALTAGEKAAAGFLTTMGGKAAVTAMVLIIGGAGVYYASGAGRQKPQEAPTAVTQEETTEENEPVQSAETETESAAAEPTAEVPSEEIQEEEDLLAQIPELDQAVADMVPAMTCYIDTKEGIGSIPEPEEFSVNNTELFWKFAHSYCIRFPEHLSEDNYSGAVRVSEMEEVARTAFADCTGLPDTLDEYANSYIGYGIYGEWLEMPLGNALFRYEMAGWETTEDGKGIDVTLDEINVGAEMYNTSYVVHLVPVEEAVKGDARLKFFITGAEEVE